LALAPKIRQSICNQVCRSCASEIRSHISAESRRATLLKRCRTNRPNFQVRVYQQVSVFSTPRSTFDEWLFRCNTWSCQQQRGSALLKWCTFAWRFWRPTFFVFAIPMCSRVSRDRALHHMFSFYFLMSCVTFSDSFSVNNQLSCVTHD
jgi:hypothetical protein